MKPQEVRHHKISGERPNSGGSTDPSDSRSSCLKLPPGMSFCCNSDATGCVGSLVTICCNGDATGSDNRDRSSYSGGPAEGQVMHLRRRSLTLSLSQNVMLCQLRQLQVQGNQGWSSHQSCRRCHPRLVSFFSFCDSLPLPPQGIGQLIRLKRSYRNELMVVF